MASATAALVLVAVLTAVGAPQDAESDLSRARVLVRQGLLGEAEALLLPLVEASAAADAPGWLPAHASLLLGNIAFERARYPSAQRRYRSVLELPTASSGLREAARENLDRAADLERRSQELASEARRLAAAVAAVALAGACACAWLARRASASAGPRGSARPA